MKIIAGFAIILLFTKCNQIESTKKVDHTVTDTSFSADSVVSFRVESTHTKPTEKLDTISYKKIDTILFLNVSEKILTLIKTKIYKEFSLFIHPQVGLRFSPYAYIDTATDRVLSANQFLKLANQNKRIVWDSNWDKDEKPELLTIDEYFKRFVYDVDFLHAPLKSINQYHSQGTDLNNIAEAYPECTVVEFFFPGFDEKYGGHDFRGLRLVYKMQNNRPYLVGIVHDQWTP
ncbi:MAG: hypothetical protein ACXWV2_11250 [Chitinophagaceae bacterium]